MLPIDEIKLDPENPRIKRGLKPPVTQDTIRKFLLEQPGVPDLQKQIRDNGGLIEQIFVNQAISALSKETVEPLSIEGFGTLSKATRDGKRSLR